MLIELGLKIFLHETQNRKADKLTNLKFPEVRLKSPQLQALSQLSRVLVVKLIKSQFRLLQLHN